MSEGKRLADLLHPMTCYDRFAHLPDPAFSWQCDKVADYLVRAGVSVGIDAGRLADAIFLAQVDVMETDTRKFLDSDEAAAAIVAADLALVAECTKDPR